MYYDGLLEQKKRQVGRPDGTKIRYSVPSVWVVLSDGGFFALLSLSMRCAGSLGFDAANKLVGPNAQNLVCDDVNKKNRPIYLAAFCKASDGFLQKLIAV